MSQQITRPISSSTGKNKQTCMSHWMRTNTSTSTDRNYHSARLEEDSVDYVKEPCIQTPKTCSNISGKEGNELSLTGFRFLAERPSDNLLYSEKSVSRKGKEVAVKPDTSVNTSFEDLNTSLLVGRDWFQKMHGIGGNSNNNKSRFDLEAMRICTTVDSVQVAPGGCPRFSQTTHSVLVTKKSKNDVLRTTRLVKRTNDNMLQSLTSLSNGEERNSVVNFKGLKVLTIRNESSAETNTMEMGMDSGENPTPSTEAFNINSNPPPPIVATTSRVTGLPDINLKLTALPDVESPPQNRCPSSSRTHSLEMDMLLNNADQTKTTKLTTNSDDLDPSNRWVKRLKPSPPNSSPRGTKISNPDERVSHGKTKNYIRSNLDHNISSSEPSQSKQEAILSAKSDESLLSNVWIKRWLRNSSGITDEKLKRAAGKVEELKGSNGCVDVKDDFERKQFPSIGAMAMMGKAMAGFQSCEVQKRGSITIWNTKKTF